MALLRMANGFDRLTDSQLALRAKGICQQISNNPALFASPTPTMPVLLAAVDNFSLAIPTAAEGGRKATYEKNALRAQLIDLLHLLSYYVLFTAQGVPQVVFMSGYELMKEPEPQVVTKPMIPVLQAGEQQGWIEVSVGAIKGAKAYLHQYSTHPAPTEEQWVTVSRTSAKIILKGLTPATLYYVRVGVVGPKEQVLFSDVSSRVAA